MNNAGISKLDKARLLNAYLEKTFDTNCYDQGVYAVMQLNDWPQRIPRHSGGGEGGATKFSKSGGLIGPQL